MRRSSQIGTWVVLLAVVSICAAPLRGQSIQNNESHDKVLAFRTVVDSAQACWRLNADATYPAGPGKWSRSALEPCGASVAGGKRSQTLQLDTPGAVNRGEIRRGDLLMVEESSDVANGYVRAVALEGAQRGETIRARLVADGDFVHVLAAGRGRAILVSGIGAHP